MAQRTGFETNGGKTAWLPFIAHLFQILKVESSLLVNSLRFWGNTKYEYKIVQKKWNYFFFR